ncbi:MAG TPA: site-specific DNA-methyltransferase [Armatimonadota bacterium]|nr:site-specific DNA-methyltransferase [Armatimonadota bacterium]
MGLEPYGDEWITLRLGDARDMDEVGDSSVSLVVTSPPYWDIKNYRTRKQIGLGQSYGEYLEGIGKVVGEIGRVLEPGRYACWVVGTRISDGDLRHIPADTIGVFQQHGFTLKKEIIWTKPKGTQGLWQRGTTQFLKKKPHPCCANINIQHETILIFQAEGEFEPPTEHVLSEEFIKQVAWSAWELPVSRTKGHPAPYPIELPRRLIQLYSAPGETVLDPFAGTGTTLAAARECERHGIGYEISEEFVALAGEVLKALEDD